MSKDTELTRTDHAMLVVWGQYAHCIGLIQALQAIPLGQKTVDYSPQGKVLEFLVAILGGLEYLKDISLSAHPLDKDQAVARAWSQSGWADHSGVSRTLSGLSESNVQQIAHVLERVSEPLIDCEVLLALGKGFLELDGDLSPRPVSDTSQTYPDAEYGHMNDQVRLGYQAAVVSMRSPTYGRIGLSTVHHSGKTVSVTQAEALVLEAERRLGRSPLRHTDLLAKRIEQMRPEGQKCQQRIEKARQGLAQAETEKATVAAQLAQAGQELAGQEALYAQRQCPERPHSYLAEVRKRLGLYQSRLERRNRDVDQTREWLTRQQARLTGWEVQVATLEDRLKRFEAENAANLSPIQAIFRLDAGFGSAENVALLIEMGYEVYTKPYCNWLSGTLAQMSAERSDWQKMGNNAEMIAWKAVQLADSPYPLDLGYERFWTGKQYRFSGLLHFGCRDVAADLPNWFHTYNARQIIEAGNKEGKQVFEVQHIKVRSRPAMRLQEHFALFAANLVRFASHWLAEQCQVPNGWENSACPKVKEQVKVGAHSPAWVEWNGQDCLVRFDDHSVYAGKSLQIKQQIAIQLVLPLKSFVFLPT